MILQRPNDLHDVTQETKASTDATRHNIEALRIDFQIMSSRLTEVETRIVTLENTGSNEKKRMGAATNKTKHLMKDILEIKDWNRRGNLHIFGLPEKVEEDANL
ncbi:hypothetical protein NDU88_006223 [Pleurodeles waltl]|uniref:Uncharacterized protein n=1 Tax=Pleurodeles waltl TaxID=8319 RepID=A0AAV7N6L9_PLEWA|nr:hypothetical protein NDU88_006223 [Pleurodeles waltl]